MTGFENVVMGVLTLFIAAPILLLTAGIAIGITRAIKDGIRND